MARARKVRKPARRARAGARSTVVGEVHLDPLLVGADREFLESFPRALLTETGAIPARRFNSFGLVILRPDSDMLPRLQRESDVRLIGVRSLNPFGGDLLLRYWTSGDSGAPPLWVEDARRHFGRKLNGLLSMRGQLNGPAALAAIILTSPLNQRCPLLVLRVGDEGQVLYLHGMGVRVGLRFPGAWQPDLARRLREEFRLADVQSADGHLIEARGPEAAGLQDLTATILPPLTCESFLIEPRGRRG